MQKLTLTVYMPDGSTKIFEDVQGIEQQDARHVTFICAGNGDGLRSVTINLDLTIGFEIDGIIPQQSRLDYRFRDRRYHSSTIRRGSQQSEEDDEDAPNEGEY